MKETLVSILDDIQESGTSFQMIECHGRNYNDTISNEDVAAHLIANGVTVQRWIPVDERLPDTVPCSAGTAYSEAVNVLTDGRKVLTAIWNGERFLCDADYWEAWGEKITHWTTVLLPLPEPPGKDVSSDAEENRQV